MELRAYAQPPYPTFHDLVERCARRRLSAKSVKLPDGKYQVTIEVESKKFKADDQGNETEVR